MAFNLAKAIINARQVCGGYILQAVFDAAETVVNTAKVRLLISRHTAQLVLDVTETVVDASQVRSGYILQLVLNSANAVEHAAKVSRRQVP